jgi:hypothetical protein
VDRLAARSYRIIFRRKEYDASPKHIASDIRELRYVSTKSEKQNLVGVGLGQFAKVFEAIALAIGSLYVSVLPIDAREGDVVVGR